MTERFLGTAVTREYWRQLEDIFDRALQKDACERVSYVRGECACDESMFADIIGLLAAHEQKNNFLAESDFLLGMTLMEREYSKS